MRHGTCILYANLENLWELCERYRNWNYRNDGDIIHYSLMKIILRTMYECDNYEIDREFFFVCKYEDNLV